jgi:hypothetical protein
MHQHVNCLASANAGQLHVPAVGAVCELWVAGVGGSTSGTRGMMPAAPCTRCRSHASAGSTDNGCGVGAAGGSKLPWCDASRHRLQNMHLHA